jgi:hypothetical protein
MVIVIPRKRLIVGTSSMLTEGPVVFGLPHPQDRAGARPAADWALAPRREPARDEAPDPQQTGLSRLVRSRHETSGDAGYC